MQENVSGGISTSVGFNLNTLGFLITIVVAVVVWEKFLRGKI